jgi:haloalkane dehalogenase
LVHGCATEGERCRSHASARRLPSLRDRPALILWPTADVAFREPERRRWESLFPDHRTTLLAGAGHYMQEDAAEEIVAAIRAWRPPA